MESWVPDISRFPICLVFAYSRIIQGSEYNWISLNNPWINCSDFDRALNMPVSQGFEYASSSKYARAQNMTRLWIQFSLQLMDIVKGGHRYLADDFISPVKFWWNAHEELSKKQTLCLANIIFCTNYLAFFSLQLADTINNFEVILAAREE